MMTSNRTVRTLVRLCGVAVVFVALAAIVIAVHMGTQGPARVFVTVSRPVNANIGSVSPGSALLEFKEATREEGGLTGTFVLTNRGAEDLVLSEGGRGEVPEIATHCVFYVRKQGEWEKVDDSPYCGSSEVFGSELRLRPGESRRIRINISEAEVRAKENKWKLPVECFVQLGAISSNLFVLK